MFEDNADVDFGDDFAFDFEAAEKNVKDKASLESQKKETSKRQTSFKLPKNVVKRKFPGPAGILPDRKNYSSMLEVPHTKDAHQEIQCSQMSLSVFQSSPWIDVLRDFESLIEIYNIKWIKSNARLKKLLDQKAPFLAAIIKSVECFEGKNVIIKVVLKDMSGEIQGTIIHSLYEEYSSSLVADSVIILRQCGVLTSYSNNHYLTITPKNLVAVYCKNDNEVAVIGVQNISHEDIMAELNQVQKLGHKNERRVEKENKIPSCSQLRIGGSEEEVEAWENALEGVDMDSLLDDF